MRGHNMNSIIDRGGRKSPIQCGNIHLRDCCIQRTVIWVRNKSCQPDLHFSEQTDVAGGTATLQLGTDVVDLDSGDSPDVTSSDVKDDVNLPGRVLIVLGVVRAWRRCWSSAALSDSLVMMELALWNKAFTTPRTIRTLPRKLTSSLTSDDVTSGESSESRSTTSVPSWRVVVPPATSVCSEKCKSGWQDLFLTHVTNPDEWEYSLSAYGNTHTPNKDNGHNIMEQEQHHWLTHPYHALYGSFKQLQIDDVELGVVAIRKKLLS